MAELREQRKSVAERKLEYAIADKAWQPAIGCSPNMPCAPNCWARRTVTRIVECQKGDHPERAAFFQQALTEDGKRWSGKVLLDEAHLADPLKWRKPALIASGFHCDWALLSDDDKGRIFAVMALCSQHRFMMLTKRPEKALEYLAQTNGRRVGVPMAGPRSTGGVVWTHNASWPLPNIHLGCSITNQADANKHRPAMAELERMGWNTHAWYEPAIGPVDWERWSFLKLIIAGGESGTNARPAHPDWFRRTRDWCAGEGVGFIFKQWGAWTPECPEGFSRISKRKWSHQTFAWGKDGNKYNPVNPEPDDFPLMMYRVRKQAAGCLLDGREHKDLACFLPEGTASRAEITRSGE